MIEEREDQEAARRRRFTRSQLATLTVLGAGAVAAAGFWWNGGGDRTPEPAAQPINQAPPPTWAEARRTAATTPPPASPPGEAAPPPPPPPPTGAVATVASDRERRMVSYAVRQPAPGMGSGTGPGSVEGGGGGGRGGAERAADAARTAVAFRGATIPGGRAGAAIDTSLVLMPGVYACVLDTALNSERPGPFFCHTTDDIVSPRRVSLLPTGTRIVAEIAEAGAAPGQARIPGLVATAWTPDGVAVPLGAVAGDELGRTGMQGRVDRHFWERFGAAVVLLASQSAIGLAQSALQQGSGNTYLNLNASGIQGVAAEALRGSVGIRNTVEKNQGEVVTFLLTKPIDFSDAYRLVPR